MVFEYVDYDLAGLLDSNYKFSESQVKSIVYQLLQVLEYCHSRGYVHRDLKCSNLLLTDGNVLKLADFGLSRALAPKDVGMTSKVITLWYRPPELLLGATEYGGAVDMWSVGCILLELISGRPAFPAKVEAEQLKQLFSVVGTPPADSWMRQLPLWDPGEVADRRPRIAEWLAKYPQLTDMDAKQLLVRLLECDPRKRITAKEALAARYFAMPPRVDKETPWAG
jgi:serine/threonine protein kinase